MEQRVSYCSKTQSMYCCGESLNQYKNYHFNFSSTGLFTLLNKEGEPLYDRTLPLFEKLVSHLIWIVFWSILILIIHSLQSLFMACIFVHLFVFGCRLTTLLLQGGLKPVLFPPLWVRLTRQFQKGKGIELLRKHRLEKHPGLLVNLALSQQSHERFSEMKTTLKEAFILCPNHPVLRGLVMDLKKH